MSKPNEPSADYKEGGRDAEKGVIETAIIDITVNHPDTPDYNAARAGEPPPDTDDKNDDKDDDGKKSDSSEKSDDHDKK